MSLVSYDVEGYLKGRVWLLLACQVALQIMSNVTQFALLWWVYALSGDVGVLAVAGIVTFLPNALLRPLAEVLAERGSPGRIVVSALITSKLCIALIIVFFEFFSNDVTYVYAVLLIFGVAKLFQESAALVLVGGCMRNNAYSRWGMIKHAYEFPGVVVATLFVFLWVPLLSIRSLLIVDVLVLLGGVFSIAALPAVLFSESQKDKGIWCEFKEAILFVRHVMGGEPVIYFGVGAIVLLVVSVVFFLMFFQCA